MVEQYILPILVFLLLGAAAGVLLTVASKLLFVKTDETVERITEALPGANCGGCGFSGCAGYAAAVAKGEAATNLCKPGGNPVTEAVSRIMGVEPIASEREYAFVRCNGNCGATEDKFSYIGTESCAAVEKFYNGKGNCAYGCHGLGDCAAVCEYGAIRMENGVSVIDPMLCRACGKCVKACPNHLITLVKESRSFAVRCYSADVGKVTRAVCKNGCIGCGLCVKKCPEGAIVVDNNHAEIDGKKCVGCGECAKACPTKCIAALPVCGAPIEETAR
ncbi:MAG: RnfABCDGE type electron transport complex subunit B [Bacteroides sp.]|nr:RnfABCDGE type electron transport complex subunit B [Eubacterium sp.]MCM1417227.1 RnfABCDGE type electron transport complex subunit B [Roseburia sp.]MCM1461152.1 RnfABCDGE type electron transport complex subunit B [Bacteroides sp.]